MNTVASSRGPEARLKSREDLEDPTVRPAPPSGKTLGVPDLVSRKGSADGSPSPPLGVLVGALMGCGLPEGRLHVGLGSGACLGPRREAGKASGLEDTPWCAPSATQHLPHSPIWSPELGKPAPSRLPWDPGAAPGRTPLPSGDISPHASSPNVKATWQRSFRTCLSLQGSLLPHPEWGSRAFRPPYREHLRPHPMCRIKTTEVARGWLKTVPSVKGETRRDVQQAGVAVAGLASVPPHRFLGKPTLPDTGADPPAPLTDTGRWGGRPPRPRREASPLWTLTLTHISVAKSGTVTSQ